MQSGLNRRCALPHYVGDLVKRIADHIHQDDAAPLANGQAHEGPQACRREAGLFCICRVNDHIRVRIGGDGIAPRALPEKIQGRIMSNAEQPPSKLAIGLTSAFTRAR
jgi:hypothetical protein